jgi:hypothetical protein
MKRSAVIGLAVGLAVVLTLSSLGFGQKVNQTKVNQAPTGLMTLTTLVLTEQVGRVTVACEASRHTSRKTTAAMGKRGFGKGPALKIVKIVSFNSSEVWTKKAGAGGVWTK